MKTMMKNASKRNIAGFLIAFALFANAPAHSQSCSVNAGVNQSTCGTTATLTGNINGTLNGGSTWSFVSGPVTPTIVSPASISTNVTGMTSPGNYVFRLSQPCTTGGTVSQTVTVTANPEPPGLAITTPDITNCNNFAAVNNLNATALPAGWTGRWTVLERGFSTDVTNQFSIAAPTSPTTTIQLLPANQSCGNRGYFFQWTITSPNGACSYFKRINAFYYPDINSVDLNTSPVTICGPGSATIPFNSCSYWSLYLPTNVTVAPISVPGGYAGTLTGSVGNGNLGVSGFSTPGTYTFNVNLGFVTCGTSKSYGPFSVTVGTGLPVASFNNPVPANFCLASAPPSITYNFTVGNATDITFLENTPAGVNFSIAGTGTTSRSITFTPISTWTLGEFRFALRVRKATDPAGTCEIRLVNGVYIYDGIAPASTSIPNTTACIPVNISSASGTVNLPDLNVTYMGGNFGFASSWSFQKISGPAAGFVSSASINATTASFSGLTAGIYTFQPVFNGPVAEELACSGTPAPPTFTITVYNQQGSNAGIDRGVACFDQIPLSGNVATAPSIGTWTMVSGPVPATFLPNANDPNAMAKLTSLGLSGTYVFRWTISDPSGNCPAISDDVNITQVGLCSPPAPVKLVSFTAEKKGTDVVLKWTTVTEENSKDFTVEWSSDGRNWHDVGVVTAAGNSNVRIDYEFLHHNPVKGVNYYRLRQRDFDGRTEYSPVAMVRFDTGTQISILPNPVRDNLYISNLKPGAVLRLNSVDGKTLYSTVVNSQNFTLNMAGYPAAIYLLSVTENDIRANTVFKVVKDK